MSGLYVHVPFCATRCPFCAFAVTTRLDRRDAWRDALSAEIVLRSSTWDLPVDTIYIGGGTPSQLGADTLAGLLAELRASFDVSLDAEVCIECHPGHFDRSALTTLREAGLTRLSIGVQSFDDEDLVALGREHTGDQARAALAAAREAQIPSVSIDLLYALPGRSRSDWERQLALAERLQPDHIAAYVLTFEPGTTFTAKRDRGQLEQPGIDAEAELFRWTHQRLAAAGYASYEASNFARQPEHRSRHNQGYWERRPYLGIGPSAHSFQDDRRWSNPASIDAWAALVKASEYPPVETLSATDVQLERLFLGLRTARGVTLENGELRALRPLLDRLIEGGQLQLDSQFDSQIDGQIDGQRAVLSLDGLATSESIAVLLANRLRELASVARI